MSAEWKKLSEQTEKVGYKRATRKLFTLPDGNEAEYTTWYETNSASVATVAITSLGKIVVAKQYRPGPECIMYELPGGGADPGEDLAQAAARELLEETGYVSDEPLVAIGKNCADAYTNNINHYFLAKNCYKQSDQQLDDTEFIEVLELEPAELLAHARAGLVSDAAALLYASDNL